MFEPFFKLLIEADLYKNTLLITFLKEQFWLEGKQMVDQLADESSDPLDIIKTCLCLGLYTVMQVFNFLFFKKLIIQNDVDCSETLHNPVSFYWWYTYFSRHGASIMSTVQPAFLWE